MRFPVHLNKKIIYKYLYCKDFLFSYRCRGLIACNMTRATEVFFARPAVTAGISGFAGASLGFLFSYMTALLVFLLLHAFLFLWILIFAEESAASRLNVTSGSSLRSRIILFFLALSLGLYCMTLISYQKSRAEDALHAEEIVTGGNESIYNGYICSISLPDESYKTFTLLWNDGVKVRFGSSRTDLAYGQHIQIYGTLSSVPSARNPGGFDQKNYYGRQGIFLSLETYDNNIHILNDSALVPDIFVKLEVMGLQLRRSISSMWTQVLSMDDAALLSGMILGDTSGMSPELKSAFRMCNLSHLTAVSGANVAYFLVPVSMFFQKLSGRRAVRQLLLFVFLIFFGFLTGWTASVTRALFMSIGSIFSSVLMRRHDPVSAMFLTSVVLMANNPYVAVDLGFLLSFSATLSLILFSDKMTQSLISFLAKATKTLASLSIKSSKSRSLIPAKIQNHKNRFSGGGFFIQAAACLICTQLGMLPWLIAMSGKESVILFLANLAGTFLSEGISLLCLPLSGILLIADSVPVILPFVRILFLPLGGLLNLLARMALLLSDKSIQALRLYDIEPLLLISSSILLLTFMIPKGFLSRNLRRIMCFFLAAGMALQIYTYNNRPVCTVIFADVGQGDSALILLNNNISILIDGGDIGSAKNVLIPMMNYYGILEPDITILTHLHRDHGSGIIELIEAGRVDEVYTPCITPNTELAGLFAADADHRVTLHSIQKNDKIVLSESAELLVLSPESISMKGGNEDSAVLLLNTGDTGILFMGDAGELTENQLLMQEKTMSLLNKDVDFLKVGHHGSKFSSTQVFLSGFSADAAVISVGANNYGHPTPDTLVRLAERNIDVYRTDYSGAIILEVRKKTTRILAYS